MGSTGQTGGTNQQQTTGTSGQQYQYGLGPIDPATQQARDFAMQLMPELARQYQDPYSDPALQRQRQSSMDFANQQYNTMLKPTYDTMGQKSGMFGSTPWAQQSAQGAQNLTAQVTKQLDDAANAQRAQALQGMLGSGQLIASSGASPVMMSSTGSNTSNMTGSNTGFNNQQGWNTGSTNTTGQTSGQTSGSTMGGNTQNTMGGMTSSQLGGMLQNQNYGQTGNTSTNTSGQSSTLGQMIGSGSATGTTTNTGTNTGSGSGTQTQIGGGNLLSGFGNILGIGNALKLF
jgi:hypothetical protein